MRWLRVATRHRPDGLRELEHEHGQRPRRRERPPLDRDHLRQIGIDEAGGSRGGRSWPQRRRASSASGSLRYRGVTEPGRPRRPPARARAWPRRSPGAPATRPAGWSLAASRPASGSVAPRFRPPSTTARRPHRGPTSPGATAPGPGVRGRPRSPPTKPRPGRRRSAPGPVGPHRRWSGRPAAAPGQDAQAAEPDQAAPVAWARPRAVAIPIRRPVNVPGPIPTAISSTSSNRARPRRAARRQG